jgi:hypothetical protein
MGTHQLIRLNQSLPHGPRPVTATLQPGAGHASAFRPPSLQQVGYCNELKRSSRQWLKVLGLFSIVSKAVA